MAEQIHVANLDHLYGAIVNVHVDVIFTNESILLCIVSLSCMQPRPEGASLTHVAGWMEEGTKFSYMLQKPLKVVSIHS